MDRGRKDAEPIVIPFGRESDLFIAELITRPFIIALIVAIGAAVLMFQDGASTRIAILLGGALLSPIALLAYLAAIFRRARTGTVKPSIRWALVVLGGFVPYAFGCYLVLYEGLWGFVRLLNTFTFGALLAATFYLIAGNIIVVAIYRVSEFGKAIDEGRIMIKRTL